MQKTGLIILYILFGLFTVLVIITRGQPVLVRKKVLLGLLILSLTAPAATLVSCSTGETRSPAQKDVWQSEGWIDGDTYRIMAGGMPKNNAKTEAEKKSSARENALLFARTMILDRFRGVRIESCGGVVDYDELTSTVQKQFGEIIKNGRVIAEKYDEEYNCYVVYEVKSPGLKKRVNEYYRYYDAGE